MAVQVGALLICVLGIVGASGRAASELHADTRRLDLGFAAGFQWRTGYADSNLDRRAQATVSGGVLAAWRLCVTTVSPQVARTRSRKVIRGSQIPTQPLRFNLHNAYLLKQT